VRPGFVFGLLLACGAGFLQPAHASDWAESNEVRSRLDQLRGRPTRSSTVPYIDATPDQAKDNIQRSDRSWQNVSYNNIAPTEPPKKISRAQSRSIEVSEVDKLGYQLNNADMRNKVLELYRRPDIVVEQYVIGQ